jgi:hypothetical protein
MANQFNNTSFVSMEILRLLLNGAEVSEQFNTNWNEEFQREFPVGSQVTIEKPQRFLGRTGMAYTAEALGRPTTTINLDQVFGVDFEWDSYERLLKMDRGEERVRKNYLVPAAEQLKQDLESKCANYARLNIPNVFGVLGTNPTASTPFLDAENRLFDKAAPDGDRKMIISSRMMASFLSNQTVQFNPASEISQQYKKGVVGMAWGWEWYRSQSLYRHTAGTWAGAVTVTGAGQSGSSLIITGTVGDTIKQGDKFSILNVNFVNPSTRRVPSGNQVQHFTALADYTLTGGSDTIAIYPAINGPGSQYQNVDALPANGAALTLWPGTSSPNGKVGTVGFGLGKLALLSLTGSLRTRRRWRRPSRCVTRIRARTSRSSAGSTATTARPRTASTCALDSACSMPMKMPLAWSEPKQRGGVLLPLNHNSPSVERTQPNEKVTSLNLGCGPAYGLWLWAGDTHFHDPERSGHGQIRDGHQCDLEPPASPRGGLLTLTKKRWTSSLSAEHPSACAGVRTAPAQPSMLVRR